MNNRAILIPYYLIVLFCTGLALHLTASIVYIADGNNPYFVRLLRRLLFLTNIGGFINLLYALIRFINVLNNKTTISPCLDTFYRNVLFLNVIVMVAYWGLIAVDPNLVRTPEDLKLIPRPLDHLLHTINPVLPWIDVFLSTHALQKSLWFDMGLFISYNFIYQLIQELCKHVLLGKYLYGFFETMTVGQLVLFHIALTSLSVFVNGVIYRPLVRQIHSTKLKMM